jgi:uncharacterized protein YdeI (YjbR/CyaY-like superfamily)
VAAVTPDPDKIHAFASAAAFERWLRAHHAEETEVWLKIHKKGSGLPTVTHAEALDVALCWGWIDAIRKSLDERSFLQRFTPRQPKSIWSQINRTHVARLIAAGRMQPAGQRQIEAAQGDGRWDAAYASSRSMTLPDELAQAIQANAKARATFATLSRQNVYALGFRLANLKTEAARKKRIATYVAMLARGETLHPNGSVKAKKEIVQASETRKARRPRKKRT